MARRYKSYDETLVENWPLTDDSQNYFSELILNNYVEVAICNNIVIGYLAGTINEKGSYENIQYCEINNMCIDDKYRGNSIGTSLINNFKKYLKKIK